MKSSTKHYKTLTPRVSCSVSVTKWLCDPEKVNIPWSQPHLEMEVDIWTHGLQDTTSSETWWLHESPGLTLIWGELLVLFGLQKETTNLLLEAFFCPNLNPWIAQRSLLEFYVWIIPSSNFKPLVYPTLTPSLPLHSPLTPLVLHLECLSLSIFDNKGWIPVSTLPVSMSNFKRDAG